MGRLGGAAGAFARLYADVADDRHTPLYVGNRRTLPGSRLGDPVNHPRDFAGGAGDLGQQLGRLLEVCLGAAGLVPHLAHGLDRAA